MERKQIFWHTKTIPDILVILHSHKNGLTKEEVIKRFEEFGSNKLPEGKKDGLFLIFLRQFQSPLIYVLFAASGIVFFVGEIFDALVIFIVLLLNAIIGTIQEGKAQNALLALKKYTETSATVLRDGKEIVIQDTGIVPGDIILLQEGEKVPADARIIFSNTLKIDEASFTGESGAVTKIEDVLSSESLRISDQKNMVFKGTHVLSGSGTAVVVATGMETEIGKIAQKISVIDTEIPLKTNIRYLSRFILVVAAALITLVMVLGIFSGTSLLEMFLVAVALSVSIIPEGLPIVMTLVLATGVRRMSKQHVLVKQLQAVEALGQTKVIAVDKTGTLTRNEMVVQFVYVDGKKYEVTGNGYEPKGDIFFDQKVVDPLNHPELLFSGKIATYCANAKRSFSEEDRMWKITGDPTEAAMAVFSEKIGFQQGTPEQETEKIFELPFDYRRKYHATIRRMEGKNFLTVVGAPENILDLCSTIWHGNKTDSLTEKKKKDLEQEFLALAAQGLRVVAYAIHADAKRSVDAESMPSLTFVGFFGMRDALRAEVKAAVQKVRAADMRVVMITGDHRLTAQAIAQEADIWREGDAVLTGEDVDGMTDEALAEKLAYTSVFARVTPDHKLRIIQAYRKRGEIVAMTGDGVNDAPSLMAADLGVAMGKIGTEVAKEASDLVLLDDNFASIVSAAEEGRGIYKTIKKVILYLFSTNTGEVLVIVGALVLGYPLPLLAIQIIWLNVITDSFLDVGLAMEPKEKGLMQGTFERPKKWIVDGLMAQRILTMSLPMMIGTLFLFHRYAVEAGGVLSGQTIDLTKAWTISLTTLAVFQWFNAWNCRSDHESLFRMNPFANRYLVGATSIVVLLQLLVLYTPVMQKMLHITSLSRSEWFLIISVAGSIFLIEEIRKFFYRHHLNKK